ncbi:phosphotransferase family protein [Gorillibacterium timonense]|uniref:phosphotransferase family protein n=1 Tax=Gorillibacterium timonense TaxID=1689269 RepID=UPI00071C92B6|nr:aminoglycoside phosphotransferase family protein [Gorillibacterium timonense]
MEAIKRMIKKMLDTMYPNYELQENTITPLKSGWAGSVYSFTIAVDKNNDKEKKDYILKIYSGTKSGVESVEKECQALIFLGKSGYPVPEYLGHDLSMSEGNNAFLVMERINGRMFWDVYAEVDSDQKKDMVKTFSRLLYELHKKDIGIAKMEYTETASMSLIDNELAEIKALLDHNQIEQLYPVYFWLQTNKQTVEDLSPAILHRDYHPWNVILNENQQPVVIDWVWGIGDYRFDLAWTLGLMERGGFDSFAAEALAAYTQLLGKEIKNLDYFKVLSTLRWLLNVSVSLISGDNLREGEGQAFRDFLQTPVSRACETFTQIMNTEILYPL